MKNKVCVIAGIILLIFALVCPLPPVFGISWMAWRILVGTFACASIALGAYRATKQ